MQIETKYSIGDKVYVPAPSNDELRIPCPDCDGVGDLKVEGKEVFFLCPTCVGPWDEKRGWITRREWVPHVECLTVSRIRVDYPKSGSDSSPFSYMCSETSSSGGGSVYYEDRCFQTRDEARERAVVEIEEREASIVARAQAEAARKAKRVRRSKKP